MKKSFTKTIIQPKEFNSRPRSRWTCKLWVPSGRHTCEAVCDLRPNYEMHDRVTLAGGLRCYPLPWLYCNGEQGGHETFEIENNARPDGSDEDMLRAVDTVILHRILKTLLTTKNKWIMNVKQSWLIILVEWLFDVFICAKYIFHPTVVFSRTYFRGWKKKYEKLMFCWPFLFVSLSFINHFD